MELLSWAVRVVERGCVVKGGNIQIREMTLTHDTCFSIKIRNRLLVLKRALPTFDKEFTITVMQTFPFECF